MVDHYGGIQNRVSDQVTYQSAADENLRLSPVAGLWPGTASQLEPSHRLAVTPMPAISAT